MNIDEIRALLPHRYPFLMIDRVEEITPGERCVAVKCVSVNEPQFQGHFPGQPIFPGVLLVEAFAQVAGIIYMSAHDADAGKAVYLLGMDKVRFRKPVVPGDRVILKVERSYARRGLWQFVCVAEVEEQKVAEGTLLATVAEAAGT